MRKIALVLFVLFMFVILSGCGSRVIQIVVTATPENQPETNEVTVMPTVAPTEVPTPAALQFYTEEFDPGSPMEQYYGGFTFSNDVSNVYLKDGKIWFELNEDNYWQIITYEAFTYSDVALTVNVENRASNAGGVFLTCRFNEGVGRYDFEIAGNGLYEIYDVHYENGKQAWDLIANGGSGKIKPGLAVNEYKIICQGQDLALYINGSQAWKGKVSASLPQYTEGQIGFGVFTSVNNSPAVMGFDWLAIEQP